GFALCAREEDSDVVVVNTCGFLKASEDESREAINRVLRLKRSGKVRGVVVAGCLPQRYGGTLAGVDGVDAVVGLGDRKEIARLCRKIVGGNGHRESTKAVADSFTIAQDPDVGRFRLTPRHYAYVRISEGCDRTCSFCAIPSIRGKFRSKPIETIVGEVRELANDGAKEINLIAQDSTSYGLDVERRTMLPELLEKVAEVGGVEWIRLLYCYPTHVTDRLIAAIRDIPKVVKYIDLPIQHTAEGVLRRMRRGITEARQKELIETIRREIPGATLRTTVIVGFPGETEEEFNHLRESLRRFRFERLGAFVYSPEPGTPAADMENQVPEEVKEERFDTVMRLQQEIAFEINRRRVGGSCDVLIDRRLPESGCWKGRTVADAPDIDGAIVVASQKPLKVGEIRQVKVTESSGYDLRGEV
ncbi:MAG: ribosomal protein S12 methylthiotransferase RimO, partial [Planctomycetes bacterium RBG_16_59_8]